ncbi:hypothetical protein [Saccharopolyspora phatthalungensis]|uniref:hypothetical protein n=1 Tax=Saccharopolyspora phatthalungensis TaxID=664693 RepID=UPI000A51EB8F|nr:hypothetical protein [Saccharopolyspora phatthalungensis]
MTARLSFMDGATGEHHCLGTKTIALSLHHVDEVRNDLGLRIGWPTRATRTG